ncbi:hypothetical protein BKA70DRAFT_382371 [Coprinopsis sp. MPI-PUGE-AT-0042]|nr:hypothetical protein BKA70DRAFT_382371 [Coprinopsis sp. MPI-PUGE-AT-0042]
MFLAHFLKSFYPRCGISIYCVPITAGGVGGSDEVHKGNLKKAQWSLKTRNGVGWYLQNVASGLYLGLPADEHARNGLPVHEVEHEFEWYLKREGDSSNCFSLYVPYTRHVIDLNPGNPKPEMVLYIYEDGKGPHQVWHLCKDLHLETSKALVDGKIYRIVNGQSKTMMTLKEDYTVACFQSDLAEGQKFESHQDPYWMGVQDRPH